MRSNGTPYKVTMDQSAVKRVTRPMFGYNSFRSARNILAGIELMLMIRNGHLLMEGVDTMPFADQYCALAGKVGPA